MNVTRVRARRLIGALVIGLCLAGAPQANGAERVALVIGNSGYAQLPRLINPVNDASDVTQSFQRLGFQVTTVKDAGFEALRVALLAFSRQAAEAEMAVVFYAGHGIEVAGENWLLPVDGRLKTDADVNSEAMNLRTVMLAVSEAKALGLVILDACRNNVFANIPKTGATRAVDRGLAPVDPAENVLVAYAARDGTTASDGTGRNSPFTAALLRHLETPGLELEFLFRNVRDDVWAATNGGQQPFLYGSLSKDEIYLKPAEDPAVATATAPVTATAAPAPSAPAEPTVLAEASDVAWSFLRNTSDADTLRRFMELFPNSNQLPAARLRVAALETAQKSDAGPIGGAVFSLASDDTPQIEEEDVKKTRPYRKSTAAVEVAWNVLKDSKDATVVRRFADRFPSSRRRAAVEQRPIQFFGAKVALANPQDPPPPPKLITRDVLLQAAEDPDVLSCFRVDDMRAPECHSALERYPLISQFTYDYRFRFTLCQALGDACGGRPPRMLQNGATLQAKALFNPVNADPAAIAAVPGGVVIAPATGPGTSANKAPGTSAPSSPTAAVSIGNPPAPPAPPAPPSTGFHHSHGPKSVPPVLAPANVTRNPAGLPGAGKGAFHNFRAAIRASGPTGSPLGVSTKSIGLTSGRHTGGRLSVGHSNIQIKSNVGVTSIKSNVGVTSIRSNVGVTSIRSNVNTLTVRTPGANTLTIRTPATVRTPAVNAIAVRTPALNTLTVRTPTVSAPTIRTPTVSAPTIRTPTVSTPTIRTPTVSITTVRTPTVRVPTVRVPTVRIR
jgi:hypothetical protein